MPGYRFTDIFRPFFHTLVAGVAEHDGLVILQQGMHLNHIGNIVGLPDDCMYQAISGIDADVGLHVKWPVVALFRLVHLRIMLAVLVLCRLQIGDQHGVDDGAFAHREALLGEMSVDHHEDQAR